MPLYGISPRFDSGPGLHHKTDLRPHHHLKIPPFTHKHARFRQLDRPGEIRQYQLLELLFSRAVSLQSGTRSGTEKEQGE